MSVIVGNGMWLSYSETDLKCPICEGEFDGTKIMEKGTGGISRGKCPLCKGKIIVVHPLMGGTTEVHEADPPKSGKALETKSPFRVNGHIVPDRKPYDDNSDDDPEEESNTLK